MVGMDEKPEKSRPVMWPRRSALVRYKGIGNGGLGWVVVWLFAIPFVFALIVVWFAWSNGQP